MINNDRIVPVTKIDLLSLYATMLKIAGQDVAILEAANVDGDFVLQPALGASGLYLANQPVKSIELGESTDCSIFFVAAYNYSGFTADGAAVEAEGVVIPDDSTLYMAALSSGSITITNVMTGEALAPASDDEGGYPPK